MGEIDRDADRRYNWASQMAKQAERAGKPVLPNSQAKVAVLIKNDDEESHKELKELFPGGTLSEAIAADGAKVDAAKLKAYAAENKLPEGWDSLPEAPAMGEDLILQLGHCRQTLQVRGHRCLRHQVLARRLRDPGGGNQGLRGVERRVREGPG